MLLPLAFALTLTTAPQQAAESNEVAPAIVPAPRYQAVPNDAEIVKQLNQLVLQQPDRVLCISLTRTGSHLPKNDCRTLRAWYNFEDDRDIQLLVAKMAGDISPVGGMLGPPYELVDEIKTRYRLPSTRSKAEARTRARAQAERGAPSRAEPPISNP
jgi:hypothetical protein